jgi:hypothetical protein
VEQLRAGVHYPRSTGEFQAWFRTDEDCLDYLEWLRWPGGFTCPRCGQGTGWRLGDGRFECATCSSRTSVTAGTIFDRTRTPLTVWFTACWLFATQKDGISALSLQRALEIGSYQTAWAMLGRLRSVLVRPGRDRLSGTVEVDETYIGGDEPGLRGGRARGKKVLTGIAVEIREPKGIGRCRMALLADGSSASLHPFVTSNVEPGATVITDAWMGYHGLAGLGYVHQRRSQPPPESGVSVSGGAEVGVDLAGDVAFQAADDLCLGQAFGGAPFDVGAGRGVGAHPGDHNAPQGVVGLPVAGGVEAVPFGLAGGGGDRGGGAQVGPGGFGAEPFGVVPGGDQEQGGGVGADTMQGEQPGGTSGDERGDELIQASSWAPGNSARRPSSRSAMRVA